MSCAGIISIPLVLACMQSVRAIEQAEGGRGGGHLLYSSYYRFRRQGTIGMDTVAIQRSVVISVSHFKSKGSDQQWPRQEENLGRTDVGDLEKQHVKGTRC